MKKGLESANITDVYLMTQPNGFFTTGMGKDGGYLLCPEYPYGMLQVIQFFFEMLKLLYLTAENTLCINRCG